jgi:hypothetical protein
MPTSALTSFFVQFPCEIFYDYFQTFEDSPFLQSHRPAAHTLSEIGHEVVQRATFAHVALDSKLNAYGFSKSCVCVSYGAPERAVHFRQRWESRARVDSSRATLGTQAFSGMQRRDAWLSSSQSRLTMCAPLANPACDNGSIAWIPTKERGQRLESVDG